MDEKQIAQWRERLDNLDRDMVDALEDNNISKTAFTAGGLKALCEIILEAVEHWATPII